MLLIFKNKERRPGVAIRRPREGEKGMPLIVVPYSGDTEKAELDYIMEGETEKERERISKGKPMGKEKSEKDAQAEHERNKLTGGAPIWVKPD